MAAVIRVLFTLIISVAVSTPLHGPVLKMKIYLPDPVMGVEVLPEVLTLQRVSAYNAVPAQTEGDPNVSSCGPNLERQIALSRDLFFDEFGRKHLCGRRVTLITSRGEVFHDYVVWDTMAPRFTDTADILLEGTDPSNAFAFGITKATLIFLD